VSFKNQASYAPPGSALPQVTEVLGHASFQSIKNEDVHSASLFSAKPNDYMNGQFRQFTEDCSAVSSMAVPLTQGQQRLLQISEQSFFLVQDPKTKSMELTTNGPPVAAHTKEAAAKYKFLAARLGTECTDWCISIFRN
jgi:hypothetical protein